jgi:putative spermidine/putrescine transport system substrate-binding protein
MFIGFACFIAFGLAQSKPLAQIEQNPLYPGEEALYKQAKAEGGTLVSYDTGPTWANWQGEFDAFTKRYGIKIDYNDIGSATTVARLVREKQNPRADTAYYFLPSGAIAMEKGVTQPFRPINFDKIPDVLKDPDGNYFAIHQGTVVFVVNTRLVKDVPSSWKDLLDPQYKHSITYLDPRTTGVGYAILLATSSVMGGSVDNIEPGAKYLAKLQAEGNIQQIGSTTEYAKFIKGEIPIWITNDFNGYKAKYTAGLGDAVKIIIPKEGTITTPYAVSMVKGAPHPKTAELWLNFIMSKEGQSIFAEGFVRPILNIKLPESVADKFLPASDYKRAKPLDWVEAEKNQQNAADLWAKLVLGQ